MCFQFCRVAFHVCSSRSLNDFKNWAGQTWVILSLISKKDDIEKTKKYTAYVLRPPAARKKRFVFSQCWARSVVQAQPVDSVPCAAVAASGWHLASGWGPLDEGHHAETETPRFHALIQLVKIPSSRCSFLYLRHLPIELANPSQYSTKTSKICLGLNLAHGDSAQSLLSPSLKDCLMMSCSWLEYSMASVDVKTSQEENHNSILEVCDKLSVMTPLECVPCA